MSNKKLLHRTFNALIEEIRPGNLIAQQCRYENDVFSVLGRDYPLQMYKNIHLLGSGKAVIPMAKALQSVMGKKIAQTLIVGAYENGMELDNTRYIKSTHPLPSQKSIDAAQALRKQLETLKEDDFFIYLLSGGNSALVELPEASISLDDFQKTTSLMLKGGMPIEEMNCVRKHLSQVKGGKLAECTRAKGLVLVLSDVLGDDLHAIGSAPLYFDTTTFDDAIASLNRHALFDLLPRSVQTFLKEGAEAEHPETPKTENTNIQHCILGSNAIVLDRARDLLDKAGVPATLSNKRLEGDASELARELVTFAQNYQGERHCFIFGGEATVTVRGEGRGGRNQHLALSVLQLLDGECDVTFLSAATDGIDGNSDAAGALVDMHSRVYALAHEIDPQHYLETYDSNTFFSKTGELLITGPTHNNLLDIVMMLIEPTPQQGENNG
jgi:glycerate 2-kinase